MQIYTWNSFNCQEKIFFQKYHYLMTPQEARHFTRPDTPVGGEYLIPEGWTTKGGSDKRMPK